MPCTRTLLMKGLSVARLSGLYLRATRSRKGELRWATTAQEDIGTPVTDPRYGVDFRLNSAAPSCCLLHWIWATHSWMPSSLPRHRPAQRDSVSGRDSVSMQSRSMQASRAWCPGCCSNSGSRANWPTTIAQLGGQKGRLRELAKRGRCTASNTGLCLNSSHQAKSMQHSPTFASRETQLLHPRGASNLRSQCAASAYRARDIVHSRCQAPH